MEVYVKGSQEAFMLPVVWGDSCWHCAVQPEDSVHSHMSLYQLPSEVLLCQELLGAT